MKVENDKVAKKDYIDLLEISVEVGEKKENQLFCWAPLHFDDDIWNLDPRIIPHAWEFGVDVERVLSEEVHNESLAKTLRIHFKRH